MGSKQVTVSSLLLTATSLYINQRDNTGGKPFGLMAIVERPSSSLVRLQIDRYYFAVD